MLRYCFLPLSLVRQIPTEALASAIRKILPKSVLMQKVKQEPNRALWQRLIGDLMLTRKMEEKALAAYEKAYSLEPANPEIMNNFAWLLLTSEDLSLRDPAKALTLARAAATLLPKGHVLDTLATAYWANGLVEEAVHTEEQAAVVDMAQKRFYMAQINKFTSQTYEESVSELEALQKTAQRRIGGYNDCLYWEHMNRLPVVFIWLLNELKGWVVKRCRYLPATSDSGSLRN